MFNGDRGIILGLFEELHKFHDGVVSDSQNVTPYLGKHEIDVELSYSYMGQNKEPNNTRMTKEEIWDSKETPYPVEVPIDVPINSLARAERVPIIHDATTTFANDFAEKDPDFVQTNRSQRKDSLNRSVQSKAQANLPPRVPLHSYKPQVTLRRKLFNFERAADIEPGQKENVRESSSRGGIYKEPRFSQSTIRLEQSTNAEIEDSQQQSKGKANSTAALTDWLKLIGIKLPSNFTLDAPILNYFKDG